MSAGAAHDVAVGVGVDVDVEVGVHLGRAQNHHVQIVHHGAGCGGTCVVHGGDLLMGRVRADGLHGLQVKALHVHQRTEAARVEHVHQIAGDAAGGEGSLNLVPHHHVHQELGRGQRRAASAGLEGEAVLQKSRVANHIHRALGHHQAHGVAGDLGGAGHDALGVADGGNLHHVVDINLRDRPAQQRIGHQVVGDHDDLLGIHRVREGVAQASAGGGAELAGAVAHGIRRGRGDESHVNGRVAQGDVPGTAAVGAEVHRLVHQAL